MGHKQPTFGALFSQGDCDTLKPCRQRGDRPIPCEITKRGGQDDGQDNTLILVNDASLCLFLM